MINCFPCHRGVLVRVFRVAAFARFTDDRSVHVTSEKHCVLQIPYSECQNDTAESCSSFAVSSPLPAKSKDINTIFQYERIFEMEGKGNKHESNASAAGVYELPGEPAIVINGVPDIIPGDGTIPPRDASSTVQTHWPLGLGEWFEGREVRKWFMGRYYSGMVTQFDKDSGWYRVLYEDGDSEDLDWQELEEVLLPLDVTIPLKALAQRVVRKGKKSVKNVAGSPNPQMKRRITKGK
ncbi:hypothetical protein VNO77_17563 [Canavalia gladiata]|uniref:PTM/DIR17-like Tudor domain-containing protein n=1 Tax=Canavalia gladiata TaxID=3824 RepID=A0AAN9QIV2_CANGL